MNQKYIEYLDSSEWKIKRDKVFDLKGRKCQRCPNNIHIHVHHGTYENIYNENIEKELFVLCKNCHEEYHKKNKQISIGSTCAFIARIKYKKAFSKKGRYSRRKTMSYPKVYRTVLRKV